MKNITILVPVHNLDGDYEKMLENALDSVKDFHNDVNVTIIAPEKLKKKLSAINFGQKLDVELLYNQTANTDFCSQINLGIDNCKTEWFSILEVDDEYQKPWLKSMNQYVNEYPDVDVFLTIVKDITPEGEFASFTNESVWAYGFSDKQGVLDNEVLLEYQNYQTSGGLYRTKTIKDNGSFKSNIKLTFSYEFLLRLTNNGVNVMTVPRIGYRHVNLREDSLFWTYKNNEKELLSEKEVKFWLDAAKKEFFYKNKRDINYVE
jgi:glycosyltransferase involved in cell wall biosynthesis